MSTISYDKLEQNGMEISQLEILDKLKTLNKHFPSQLNLEKGVFGITETKREDGTLIKQYRNEDNSLIKDYFLEGKQLLRKVKIDNGNWIKTLFDDNGTPYLTETIKWGKDVPREVNRKLAPNVEIIKGNFRSLTDNYGRPIMNKVINVKLKETGRNSLNIDRSKYPDGYERGHVISDQHGGPSSIENIVPQAKEINHGAFRDVEKMVEKYVSEGKQVDYEMKINFVGKPKGDIDIPSSFEPKITVDGNVIKLPKELRKIFNKAQVGGAEKAITSVKEHVDKTRPLYEKGIESGFAAAGITFTVSTADNMSAFINNDISVEEMVADIVKDTAAAGLAGYGTSLISTAVSQAFSQSSNTLIQRVAGNCLPSAAVTFAVESYDSISDFARGQIDGAELAYDLGESAAGIAGSLAGGAAAGAAVGTFAGPAGTVAGGIAGGVVGCALASEVYATAVEIGAEGAELVAEQAEKFAKDTIELVKETIPDQAGEITDAFHDFVKDVHLPFSL